MKAQICVFEARSVAKGKNRALKLEVDEINSLVREFFSCIGVRNECRSNDKPFQWTQSHAIHKSNEIKETECISLSSVDCLSKSVCKDRVPTDALSFRNKKPKGKSIRTAKPGARSETLLRMVDKTTYEVQISFYAMLFRELEVTHQNHLTPNYYFIT